jgi:hypothetical protein
MTRKWKQWTARAAAVTLGLMLVEPGLVAAAESHGDAHQHHASHASSAASVDSKSLPRIAIVSPAAGANVKPNVTVEFETVADLTKMTMGGTASGGAHLHIDFDGTTLMPSSSQLEKVGKERYRYAFDLPAATGKHVIRVYWSDSQHRVIEQSVQQREVVVVGSK